MNDYEIVDTNGDNIDGCSLYPHILDWADRQMNWE
jgi:hypothetical protein